MIKTLCSNGTRISHATAMARYTDALREKHEGMPAAICECGCGTRAVHNDHTIAKARCKQIHKTELIYDPDNFESSCERAHKQWENFKSGDWIKHANVERRLAYLKKHDPEGFTIRIELTKLVLENE